MLNVARGFWLASALVPGFAAAVLYEIARLRLLYCSASGLEPFPAALSSWPNLLAGLSMPAHLTGAMIFLPLMLVATVTQRAWAAVGISILWMAGVLWHLGLQIPETCGAAPLRQEPLVLYAWPSIIGAMILFRLFSRRTA